MYHCYAFKLGWDWKLFLISPFAATLRFNGFPFSSKHKSTFSRKAFFAVQWKKIGWRKMIVRWWCRAAQLFCYNWFKVRSAGQFFILFVAFNVSKPHYKRQMSSSPVQISNVEMAGKWCSFLCSAPSSSPPHFQSIKQWNIYENRRRKMRKIYGCSLNYNSMQSVVAM